MEDKLKDRFGFFIDDFKLRIGSYIIDPVNNHSSLIQETVRLKHPDDRFYHPIVERYKVDPFTKKPIEKIPNTKKPAHLYRMPHTHIIYSEGNQPLPENFRQKDGALIIHLLAMLYKSRAQFDGWLFDTPLPLKQDGIAVFNNSELEVVMNTVYGTFSTWKKDEQTRYINTLYLHSRSPAYRWEWEQFFMEYIITDSLWKLFKILKSVSSNVRHSERIKEMCNQLGIMYKQNEVDIIVTLRNDLFHEGLWDKVMPGCAPQTTDSLYAVFNLRRLNQRFFLALAGVNSSFIKSDWTYKDMFALYP